MDHSDPSYFFSNKLIWNKLSKLYPLNDTIVDYIIHLALTLNQETFIETLTDLSQTIDLDTAEELFIDISSFYSDLHFNLKHTALHKTAPLPARYITINPQINVPLPINFRVARNVKSALLKSNDNKEFTVSESVPSVQAATIHRAKLQLPIDSYADTIKDAVANNRVVILQGDPGCGKSTRLPGILRSMGYNNIAITEPRRVAAISLADRVASDHGQEVGNEIGYIVRFGVCTSANTKVTFMTDGILLKMLQEDDQLSAYDVIVLDDCHNRSIATELLVGFLSKITKKRPSLKIIISSATIDVDLFTAAFTFQVPVLKIPGRTFPVDIHYSREAPSDYIEATIETVKNIIKIDKNGHILAFLTGKNEIDYCVQVVSKLAPHAVVLPLYAALDRKLQQRVFEDYGKQKIIFTTNIAEAAITINDILHVIDCGLMKEDFYDPSTSLTSLRTVPISKDQANQRSGRAGRTIAGTCHRLYPKSAFNYDFIEHPIPEISRTNLSSLIITLKSLNVDNIGQFPFIESPHPQLLSAALDTLSMLKALDSQQFLTINGYFMSVIPLDPQLVSLVVESSKLGIGMDGLILASFLTAFTSFKIPSRFKSDATELSSIVNMCKEYLDSDHKFHWAHQNKIPVRELKDFEEILNQTMNSCVKYGISLQPSSIESKLIQAAIKAFPLNCAHLVDDEYIIGSCKSIGKVYNDCLLEEAPQWIHYVRAIKTSKIIISAVSVIDTSMMLQLDNIYAESRIPSIFDDKRFTMSRTRVK